MSERIVKLIIDGKEIFAKPTDTILKAAIDNGIQIPTLCYLEGLTPHGGCRLCVVEVKGNPKLMTSCTTPVSNNMEIITNSPKLIKYRKQIIELLLAERIHTCSVCIANGSCELQELASKFGVDHTNVSRNWERFELDMSHERFVLDHNRCILCTRCIRVCDEIEGVHTLDIKRRGKDSMIIVDLDEPWSASYSCTSCGKCSAVCPVGAIYVKGKPLSETKRKELPKFITERRRR
ncbi:MAG: 2Fe-2S iron-sulfur cluster-binding protein [Nitrososphaeria archaeon]|nr:2Fe-2S iron-sulfur cluster-binding protein [Nitrososphaeria archaeon]